MIEMQKILIPGGLDFTKYENQEIGFNFTKLFIKEKSKKKSRKKQIGHY